jgi:hypothetical protein
MRPNLAKSPLPGTYEERQMSVHCRHERIAEDSGDEGEGRDLRGMKLVELSGIEPLASSLRTRRSPS